MGRIERFSEDMVVVVVVAAASLRRFPKPIVAPVSSLMLKPRLRK